MRPGRRPRSRVLGPWPQRGRACAAMATDPARRRHEAEEMVMSTGVDDVTLSDEEAEAFRAKCRKFLEEHATGIVASRGDDDRGKSLLDGAKKFQKALAEAGIAGAVYPKEY